MRRTLPVLIVLSAIVVFVGAFESPAAADQIGSTINFRVSETLPGLTYDQIVTIQAGLLKTVEFNRKKTAWACVERPTVSSDELGDLGDQFRPTEVFIYVKIGRSPNGDDS